MVGATSYGQQVHDQRNQLQAAGAWSVQPATVDVVLTLALWKRSLGCVAILIWEDDMREAIKQIGRECNTLTLALWDLL